MQVTCHRCKKTGVVPTSYVGKSITCRSCLYQFEVQQEFSQIDNNWNLDMATQLKPKRKKTYVPLVAMFGMFALLLIVIMWWSPKIMRQFAAGSQQAQAGQDALPAIDEYLKHHLDDPNYQMVKVWDKTFEYCEVIYDDFDSSLVRKYTGKMLTDVHIRFRSKNKVGAIVMHEMTCTLRDGIVIKTTRLDGNWDENGPILREPLPESTSTWKNEGWKKMPTDANSFKIAE